MTFADALFENEMGHRMSISLGSCHRADREGKSVLMEVSGEDSRTVLVLTPMELDQLLKLGASYQKKFARDSK